MQDFTPEFREFQHDGNRYIEIGPIFLSEGSDSAYLYDPEGEEPYEVAISGSKDLSLDENLARKIRDRLNAFLGEPSCRCCNDNQCECRGESIT